MELQSNLGNYCDKLKTRVVNNILLPPDYGNITFPELEKDVIKAFNWAKYNESQTKETPLFFSILKELCELIPEKEIKGKKGRKRRRKKEIVFSLLSRIYSNKSFRRSPGDISILKKAKYTDNDMPFSTLLTNMNNDELTEVLLDLIEVTSLPLRSIENKFAIDATGYGVNRYETYYDWKHGKNSKMKVYKKFHAVCGVKTNIATAVVVTDSNVSDHSQFKTLAINTSRNFTIDEFYADKGYLSKINYNIIRDLGGLAFIPFKKNSTGKGVGGDAYVFKTMLKIFLNYHEYFMKKYHLRSNAESLFSMLKRKFGNNIRCKNYTSQVNEVLGIVLANNICILIKEIFLNNLDVNFKKCLKTYNERK